MRIKDLPLKEKFNGAYIPVDDDNGTGKMLVDELGGETIILEYGDESTYDDVLAMLNAGKRVLVSVDPFYNNNNAIGSDGVQKYPVSPYKVLFQGNIPTGNPYIDFTGYTGGSVVQVAHVQLWNSSVPSMPSKINNWCVGDVNPIELAKKSDIPDMTTSNLVYIIDYASDNSIKGASSNNYKKFLDINAEGDGLTGGEGGHTMRLSLCGVASDTFGGVGLWDGVLSYVQARVTYIPYTGQVTRNLIITPLQASQGE